MVLVQHRYTAVVNSVTSFICEVLPESVRDTKPGELAYEDLEKLQPEEVLRLCEWLTDKVCPA
jgi:hypothetical protein